MFHTRDCLFSNIYDLLGLQFGCVNFFVMYLWLFSLCLVFFGLVGTFGFIIFYFNYQYLAVVRDSNAFFLIIFM